MTTNELYDWDTSKMLEVSLNEPDDFLKIMETLSRIGVPSRKDKKLFQSCHILHKRGKYYILHFKELFLLDGKRSTLDEGDVGRRNTITILLSDWGLLDIVGPVPSLRSPMKQIKILSYAEKGSWELCPKYSIGNN